MGNRPLLPFSRTYDLDRQATREATLRKLRISADRLTPQAREALREVRNWPRGAPSCTNGPLNGGTLAALDQWGLVRRDPDPGPLGGKRAFLTPAGEVVVEWLESGRWAA